MSINKTKKNPSSSYSETTKLHLSYLLYVLFVVGLCLFMASLVTPAGIAVIGVGVLLKQTLAFMYFLGLPLLITGFMYCSEFKKLHEHEKITNQQVALPATKESANDFSVNVAEDNNQKLSKIAPAGNFFNATSITDAADEKMSTKEQTSSPKLA